MGEREHLLSPVGLSTKEPGRAPSPRRPLLVVGRPGSTIPNPLESDLDTIEIPSKGRLPGPIEFHVVQMGDLAPQGRLALGLIHSRASTGQDAHHSEPDPSRDPSGMNTYGDALET